MSEDTRTFLIRLGLFILFFIFVVTTIKFSMNLQDKAAAEDFADLQLVYATQNHTPGEESLTFTLLDGNRIVYHTILFEDMEVYLATETNPPAITKSKGTKYTVYVDHRWLGGEISEKEVLEELYQTENLIY